MVLVDSIAAREITQANRSDRLGTSNSMIYLQSKNQVHLFSLPTELHLGILQMLEFHDLKQMSMLCKSMRATTLHLLFRAIQITMLPGVQDHAHAYLEDFKLRVAFCRSGDVAPHVRLCKITLNDNELRPNGGATINDSIFKLLLEFPKLDTLCCFATFFSADRMAILGKLPNLTSVAIFHCYMSPNLPQGFRPPRVPLTQFTIAYHRPGAMWPICPDPNELVHLMVYHSELPLSVHSLRNLRQLWLERVFTAKPPVLSHFLTRCPTLQRLYIVGMASTDPSLLTRTTVLPLVTYAGPVRYVPFIARSGMLLNADVTFDFDLLLRLAELAPRLSVLTVRPSHATVHTLLPVCSFPRLTQFKLVCTQPGAMVREEFIRLLIRLPLARTLQNIHLLTMLRCESADPASEHADYQLLQAWARQFPALHQAAFKAALFRWDYGAEEATSPQEMSRFPPIQALPFDAV